MGRRPDRDNLRRGVELDDPERCALRIAEDSDAADLGHVHRLRKHGAAELCCRGHDT